MNIEFLNFFNKFSYDKQQNSNSTITFKAVHMKIKIISFFHTFF